jgi:hypothetical protein
MSMLNRTRVLNTLIRHETLTLEDLAREENIGMVPNEHHLRLLLEELEADAFVKRLNGAVPCTYTITDSGIKEGKRLRDA